MGIARSVTALLAAALLGVGASACSFAGESLVPSGRPAAENRPVAAFTGLSLSLPADVTVTQASPAAVRVEADDNLLPEIETVVEAGTLKLRFRRALNVVGNSRIRVSVTAPVLESLAVAGSGDVAAGRLEARELAVSIAGSGDVRLARLEAQKLRVSIAGSGDFRAAGRAAELSGKIAGSGDIDAGRLESARVTLAILGSGNALVWAKEQVTASIAGSGDVRYHGDPAVTKSVAGSGSVKRLGPAP